jgi:hypothetical protein
MKFFEGKTIDGPAFYAVDTIGSVARVGEGHWRMYFKDPGVVDTDIYDDDEKIIEQMKQLNSPQVVRDGSITVIL